MERRRDYRLAVELPGTLQFAECAAKPMWFSQVSANGCRISGNVDGLALGDVIDLDLGPVGAGRATVRWARDKVVGVEFHVALHPAIVEYLAGFLTKAA
jgi:hypothetical protein